MPTESSERQTAAQRIATSLKRHGVTSFFGQSLPSALVLAAEDLGIRQIVYRTENAGGAMADGYSRTSGKVGVVTAQNGPAATLLVPPLAEALKSSIPIVALVQDVERPTVDRNAFQDLDHIALFSGSAKWVRRVNDGARVEEYVDQAFAVAASGRPGPAVLLLPADMLREIPSAAPFQRINALGTWPIDRTVADPATVSIVARLLVDAKYPIVIAGGGAHASQASDTISTLQEQFHIPVAYTVMGKGIVDDGHPLTMGLIGNVNGTRSLAFHTKELLEQSDLILLVGTRTNQNGTDNWSILPQDATVVHLDIDGEEAGRTYESVRMVGDARLTLQALIRSISNLDVTQRVNKRSLLEQRIARAKADRVELTKEVRLSEQVPIRPERIMHELQPLLTPETIVVADASYSSVWITSYLDSLAPGMRFIAPRGLAGLGWGFPMALGAKVANPNRPVVCLVGDGGFGHCWSELETARRMGISVILLVLNNSVLGFQKEAETVKFGRYTSACHFTSVDHAAIAAACGIVAHRIEDPAILKEKLRQALKPSTQGTVLLDVITDPDAYPPVSLFEGKLDY